MILNEETRNTGYSGHSSSTCDNSLDDSIWYRMMPPAGTMIPEEVVSKYRCGSTVVGWMDGVHPKILGENVVRKVCFHWDSNHCLWSTNIDVTNCGEYYVYKLPIAPTCNYRYCATYKGNFFLIFFSYFTSLPSSARK